YIRRWSQSLWPVSVDKDPLTEISVEIPESPYGGGDVYGRQLPEESIGGGMSQSTWACICGCVYLARAGVGVEHGNVWRSRMCRTRRAATPSPSSRPPIPP